MPINVEVTKNQNENPINLIKRFSRRVKGSGIIPRMRKIVHSTRPESDFKKKKRALKSMERRAQRERLQKLGKLPV